jgi:2-phosphosulfolactate phosphatase
VAQLFVHNLPTHVAAADLAESTVIVIDMLRATSTICYALAAGAKCVVPLLEIEETLQLGQQLGREYVVLGGERSGKIIEGFDLGNSPREYTPQRVLGKMVLFTTTNGTRALAHASEANRVLVGSVVNRATVAAAAMDATRVDILCSGTDGEVTGEDILAAGAIADQVLRDSTAGYWDLNEPAQLAQQEWQKILAQSEIMGRPIKEVLAVALRDTIGGKNLLEVGHQGDLIDCAQLDSLAVLPELNRTARQITLR